MFKTVPFIVLIVLSALIHSTIFIHSSPEENKAFRVPIKLTIGSGAKEEKKNSSNHLIPKTGTGKKSCPNTYGGVGIVTVDPLDESAVFSVAKGYSADRAGIVPGDIIVNRSELRGEPGTEVTILFIRNNVLHKVKVKRELICTKD